MTTDYGADSQSHAKQIKSLTGLYAWVRGFFVAYVIGFSLMGVASLWFVISVPPDYDVAVDLIPADFLLVLGSLIGMPALVGSIILFSIYTFRAMKNLHQWGARNARMAPGWAVGWYFIPFANLFMPYQGMDQIVDGSLEVNELPATGTSRLLLWWACWVIGGILDRIAFRIGGGLTEYVDLSAQKLSAQLSVISCALLVTAALTILSVLRDVTQLQEQRRVENYTA